MPDCEQYRNQMDTCRGVWGDAHLFFPPCCPCLYKKGHSVLPSPETCCPENPALLDVGLCPVEPGTVAIRNHGQLLRLMLSTLLALCRTSASLCWSQPRSSARWAKAGPIRRPFLSWFKCLPVSHPTAEPAPLSSKSAISRLFPKEPVSQ